MQKGIVWRSLFYHLSMAVIFFSLLSNITLADVADFAGTYAGTFEGDDTGIWRAIVKKDGYMEAITWSTLYNEVNWGIENIDANGNFSFYDVFGNYIITGSIDSEGNLSATCSGGIFYTMIGQIVQKDEIAQYVGTYSGTCTGDETWNWSGNIQPDGRMVSSNGEAEGAIGPDGRYIAVDSDNTGYYGVIDQIGNITGYWHNPTYGMEGQMSGSRTSSKNGGGGGGGCFLNSVTK